MSNISNNPYTLTGLTSNTNYEFYVRGVCDVATNSAWIGPIKFKTTCEAVSSFFENFGTLTTFSGSNTTLPNCWDKAGAANRVNITTITPITVPPHNNKLSMSSIGSTTVTPSVTYALMPPVSSLQATTHRIRFKGYTSSNTIPGILQFGYLTDAYDELTYTNITNFTLPVGVDNEELFVYNLPFALPSNAVRLAFKFEGITTGTTQIFVLIDDVYWEAIPTCDEPNNLSFSQILNNSVQLAWSSPFNAPALGYEYYISTDFTPPTDSTVASGFVASGITETTVTGLIPSSNYYVWIRSVCSTSNKSYFTNYVTFKTLCDPVDTITENFDLFAPGTNNPLPDCWDRFGILSNINIASGSVAPASAPNRLFMNSNTAGTNVNLTYAALPLLTNLLAETHRLRFKAYTTSGQFRYLQLGYVTDAMNMDTFVLIEEFLLPENAPNAIEYFYTPFFLPSDAVRLVFKNPSVQGGVTSIYLDDVFWESVPTCKEVINVQAGNFSTTTADIFWTEPISLPSNGYQYYISAVNVPPTSSTTPSGSVGAGITTAKITGLEIGTQYFVWVRSNCGTEFSFWSGPAVFNTECAPITDFIENFDGVVTPNLPSCWSKITRGFGLSPFTTIGTTSTNVAALPNFTTPNAVQLSAQFSQTTAEIILVSPNISNLAAGTHRLKFHSYYPGVVEVGTLDNNNQFFAVFHAISNGYFKWFGRFCS